MVLRQYEGDAARICARSMTQKVRILVAHALSHLGCPYVLGIARLAQRQPAPSVLWCARSVFAGWAPQEKFKPCSSENGDYFTQHIVFPTFRLPQKVAGSGSFGEIGKETMKKGARRRYSRLRGFNFPELQSGVGKLSTTFRPRKAV